MSNAVRFSGALFGVIVGAGICSCGAQHTDSGFKTEGIEGVSVQSNIDAEVSSTEDSSTWSPSSTWLPPVIDSTSCTSDPSWSDPSSAPPQPTLPDYDAPTPPRACAVEGDVTFAVTTEQEFVSRLTGRWVICSGEAFSGRPNQWFGNQHDALDLRVDGTWQLLKYDAAGDLKPLPGSVAGTWSVVTRAPGDYLLQFLADSGASNQAGIIFQDKPAAIRLNSMETMNTYVAEGEVTQDYEAEIAAQPPWQPEQIPVHQAANAERCGQRGEFSPVTGTEDLEQRITHRWIHCSGEYWFDRPHDGVEFRADGTWAFLAYTATGDLVARKGLDGGGHWRSEEYEGAFYINAQSASGTSGDIPLFWTEPEAMRMLSNAEYVLAE